jgi:hypothetical protein
MVYIFSMLKIKCVGFFTFDEAKSLILSAKTIFDSTEGVMVKAFEREDTGLDIFGSTYSEPDHGFPSWQNEDVHVFEDADGNLFLDLVDASYDIHYLWLLGEKNVNLLNEQRTLWSMM